MKRHAFLIASHNDPEMTRRLIWAISHPRVDVFLHVDRRSDPRLYGVPGVFFVPKPIAVQWGGWDLVEATLLLLKQARRHGDYSHFTHLSGQDYPLRPIEEVLDAIEAHPGQWVDLSWSDDDRSARWGEFHVTTIHPAKRFVQRGFRLAMRVIKRVPIYKRPLPKGIGYGCGSALWSLDRRAVDWMFDFMRKRPDVPRFFRNTAHTSEFFVHCLMQSSPFKAELGSHTHYTDWSRGGYHPEILREQDFGVLISSGKLFARKFHSEQSAALIKMLDEAACRGARNESSLPG